MENVTLSKLFFDVTDDLVFLLKIQEDGTFLFGAANQPYYRLTGLAEDAADRPLAEIFSIKSLGFDLSRFREAVELKSHLKYEEKVSLDGADRILETSLHPFYNDAGLPEYLLGISRDITEKKLAERELKEREQRYRSLFYNTHNPSFAIDNSGVFVELNDAVQHISGYTSAELYGKHFLPIVAPKDMQKAMDNFADLLQGKSCNYELTIIHKEGFELEAHVIMSPTIVNGQIIGAIGIARDITTWKKAQQLLRESEERYRIFIQQSPDPIIIYDEGRIIYCNQATARLIGLEHPSELEGRFVTEFLHPDHRQIMEQGIEYYINEKRPIPTFETRIVKINGEHADVEVTSALVENSGHAVLQLVLRDITKRKLEEERLQRLSQLDGLTNIANRRYFDSVLKREIHRAKRTGSPLSLILFDIDLFKLFNDCYGHLEGDDCLRKLADMAGGLIKRQGDLLARYGGEEFAVLLPDTDASGARHIAEQLRVGTEMLRIPHAKSDVFPYVTISLGVASAIPTIDFKASDLIQPADQALYEAKSKGKNRVEVAGDS